LKTEIFLTHREREVLALVAEGYQNKEIAWRLHLSTSAVKFHVSSLLKKYNVDGRIRLVSAASKETRP
jgi:DNA-binding NarL/FixJ family response regulator